jgi:hypothetical protein
MTMMMTVIPLSWGYLTSFPSYLQTAWIRVQQIPMLRYWKMLVLLLLAMAK